MIHRLGPCIVLIGRELVPTLCQEFAWDAESGQIVSIVVSEYTQAIRSLQQSEEFLRNYLDMRALKVVIPAFTNAHTHVGDSCLPDGATGLTLEEAFFRPAGFKYRMLQQIPASTQVEAMKEHLQYMAATGTTRHVDFREQGVRGVKLLRDAGRDVGIDSVILSQFYESPFDEDCLNDTGNSAQLPIMHEQELEDMLAAGADGFSESTMNDLTDAAWSRVREITTGHGKIRAIHCLESDSYRNTSMQRYGCGDLDRAFEILDPHLVIHMTIATRDEIELAAQRSLLQGTHRPCFVLCPRANSVLGLPVPPIAELLSSGLTLLLGTDNVMLNAPNMFAEMDYAYKLCKSQFGDSVNPDPLRILQMATVNASALPQIGDCHLEQGLPATFVVLDFGSAPHLRRSCNIIGSIVSRAGATDVQMTVNRGRCVYQRS